jgi:hypothetical protein
MMKYQNVTNKMTQLVKVKSLIWPLGQSSRSKVTNNGTRHIVWRWSTYMPNMVKSLIWPRGQSSRVTNNGTRHIIWRWSTYMQNMKSLSWTTKKLQPGHDLLWTHGPDWPWGQSSRSKVTNNGMWHIVWRWSTYMPNM